MGGYEGYEHATKALDKRAMLAMGLEEAQDRLHPHLMICSSAHEKRGKTHWAFTMPGPIGVIYTDTGTKEIAAKFKRDFGKKIFLYHYAVPDRADSTREKEAEWDKLKKNIREMALSGYFRSVLMDTGTEVWETLRMARFGKLTQVMPQHYTEANTEMSDLIKVIHTSPINSVWIHKVKKEYKGTAGKDSWTGKYERSGFSQMGYMADVVVEHDRSKTDEGLEFLIRVIDSRYEAESLIGEELCGDLCNFPALASMCWPDTNYSYWE